MKLIIAIAFGCLISGCSLFGTHAKRSAEVVPSCFSDGENQTTYCKTKRINEDNKIVTTRCLGSQNQMVDPVLRGKCVEKICTEGSNTDCQTRGEFAVLEQYAELTAANMFSSDEAQQPTHGKRSSASNASTSSSSTKESNKEIKLKVKDRKASDVAMVQHTSPAPETKSQTEKKSVKDEEAGDSSMQLVLRPAKKSRSPASAVEPENGFKKICIAKNETTAPKSLRGKCATRNCRRSKCSYQGRKEMFEWAANRSEPQEETY